MYLGTFAVVFVFASEVLTLETIKNLCDRLCGLCQHRFQGNAGLQLAVIAQVKDTMLEHCRNDDFIAW